MAGLGNDLVVNLAGNNSKLKTTIAESKGGLKSFASSAAGMLNPLTAGLAAVTGGAIAAGAAIWGLTSRIGGLAGIADQATQTGLNGAFIQRLGYAADQSGVSVETLIGGVKKLTIAIGKGDTKPFEALGLNIAEIKSMRPEDQFMAVAAAIAKLPTAADRAAAAVKIFGKSGIEMTGLFAGGMNDLNALMADAAKLGIGVSDESLAKAAAADDAIQRMKASFGALLDQVAIGLAPTFQGIATSIADMIAPTTVLFDKFNNMGDKAQFISDVLNASFDVAFEGIKEKWDDVLMFMADQAKTYGKDIAVSLVDPFGVRKLFEGESGNKPSSGAGGLAGAQDRLNSVLGRLTNAPGSPGMPQAPAEPAKSPVDGKQVAEAFGGLFDALKPIGAQIGTTIEQTIADAKIKGGGLLSTVGSMFTSDRPAAKQVSPQFAGAMQKGSSEAYSTIIAAMRSSKDPVVNATMKAADKVVKAVKESGKSSPPVVESFA